EALVDDPTFHQVRLKCLVQLADTHSHRHRASRRSPRGRGVGGSDLATLEVLESRYRLVEVHAIVLPRHQGQEFGIDPLPYGLLEGGELPGHARTDLGHRLVVRAAE